MDFTLWNGDCLELMENIPNHSIDMILADLPYGTTFCSWDVVIPFEPLWKQYKRIVKEHCVIALFGSEPFSTLQRMSNLDWYKYDWYWEKTKPNGWQHSKNKPMTKIETVSIFSPNPIGYISLLGERRMAYNPVGVIPLKKKRVLACWHGDFSGARPNQVGKEYTAYTNFPSNILQFPNITGRRRLHTTQKPVELLEYVIKTYT